MNKKHLGSTFDSFLEEEGILEDCESVAAKRVFVKQVEKELKKQKLSKSIFAKRMNTSRAGVSRVLNPRTSSSLKTLGKAARALGKHFSLSIT